MILNNIKSTYLFLFLWMNFQLISCAQQPNKEVVNEVKIETELKLKTGAARTELYLDKLKGKNIAIVANQTSVLEVLQRTEEAPNKMGSKLVSRHLVDYLYENRGVNVKKVFAPEHGFRGKADAGETIIDGIDSKTGIPIVSLYGKNKKPSKEQLKEVDIVVFDIQDVGARFYTYISSLHYVMEACAELGIPVIVLDRPNPNGHYIDGPILEKKYTSFVGLHQVPIIYGMTIGEYGKMINGEGWLANGLKCDYSVIPLKDYIREDKYSLPIKPSPNLPNDIAINLYPSLCFFEGTTVSAGRGTENQFQIYGAPNQNNVTYTFTPKPNEGSKHPKHKNVICYGEDLRTVDYVSEINLSWLLKAYNNTANKEKFFIPYFETLAGTKTLRNQIIAGKTAKEIKETWQLDLDNFKGIRDKYLIYK